MIASVLAGDTQQYHELIRPYERAAYVMALSVTKNEADAEDVAQESFLKAFRNLASFRANSKFSTWLLSIAFKGRRSSRLSGLPSSPEQPGLNTLADSAIPAGS